MLIVTHRRESSILCELGSWFSSVCLAYFSYVRDVSREGRSFESVPVFREYVDVTQIMVVTFNSMR